MYFPFLFGKQSDMFAYKTTIAILYKTWEENKAACLFRSLDWNWIIIPTAVSVPYCSCCLCLYFGSAIMLVTYFVNFR